MITLDITDVVKRAVQDDFNRGDWQFNLFDYSQDGPTRRWKIGGRVGEWLTERGHSSNLSEIDEPVDITHYLIDMDEKLALLFKLTWM